MDYEVVYRYSLLRESVENKKDPAVPEYQSTVINEDKDRKTAIVRKDETIDVVSVNSSHSIENYPEDNNI